MSKQIIVTDEGLNKLKEELAYLKDVKRKEVIEAIRVALGYGDLSENSEYDEAKNEQAKVEGRIQELEEMLKHVQVIDDSKITNDEVHVGSKVLVYDENWDEEVSYLIVGSTEADPMENKISDQSPIGMALLGARLGETVHAETPGGVVKLKIMNIEKN